MTGLCDKYTLKTRRRRTGSLEYCRKLLDGASTSKNVRVFDSVQNHQPRAGGNLES